MLRPYIIISSPLFLTVAAIVSPAYAADVTITSTGTFIISSGNSVEFDAAAGASNTVSTVLTSGSTSSTGTIILGAGSTTTFVGAVGGTPKLKRLDLNGTLATFNANLGIDTVNFGADGTGTLSFQRSGQTTVDGTIGSVTTSGSGQGTVAFGGGTDATIQADVGSATAAVKSFQVGGARETPPYHRRRPASGVLSAPALST